MYHWKQKDVDYRSDDRGEVMIEDMWPGEFPFQVESITHARWWSDQAAQESHRKSIPDPKTGWQRNFDGLAFDLKPGMAAATIVAEPAVRVTGKVVDPDGKPIAGATVAPALTGSGNPLPGDNRFSAETKADGTFVLTLPASGASQYSLVAHDGKCGEWRTWANGVLPPIKTIPGQLIEGGTLKLTRPAVVRGKVVDEKGQPIVGRDVWAHAADLLENHDFDPITKTKEDGTFELKFVRPAEQHIQAYPLLIYGKDPPKSSTTTLTLKEGQVVENVKLITVETPWK